MQFETLDISIDGAIATLTLNRPERLNALNPELMRELIAASAFLSEQWEVRVVIVEGAGRAFCAGADLTETPVLGALPGSGYSWAQRREIGQIGLRMTDAVEQMRPVTIAKIHGAAIGGGFLLASACDMRVAVSDTTMSIPEVQLGIPLAWGGIPRLVREFGPALTKELVMTCREFAPSEAKDAGFLNRVVDANELDQVVAELADSITDKPTAPVAITKEHVNAVARGMASSHMTFSDGDALTGVVMDPESTEAATQYVRSKFGD